MKPLSLLTQIRRNHALEHATIHVLSTRFPHASFVGRSDGKGFYLYGHVSTVDLHAAVMEALTRLRRGEHQLAIHPNCGTNIVSAAFVAGGASLFFRPNEPRRNWRDRLENLPLTMGATLLALLVARPLGEIAQKHLTTQADPGTLVITDIYEMILGQVRVHRVLTSMS